VRNQITHPNLTKGKNAVLQPLNRKQEENILYRRAASIESALNFVICTILKTYMTKIKANSAWHFQYCERDMSKENVFFLAFMSPVDGDNLPVIIWFFKLHNYQIFGQVIFICHEKWHIC